VAAVVVWRNGRSRANDDGGRRAMRVMRVTMVVAAAAGFADVTATKRRTGDADQEHEGSEFLHHALELSNARASDLGRCPIT
jgi:hypothetical protein